MEKKRRATMKKEKERQEHDEGMRDLPPLIARLKEGGFDVMSLFTGKQSKLNKQRLIEIAKSHYEEW
eukprot:8927472-Ditylum_brightwellii.AAC.1